MIQAETLVLPVVWTSPEIQKMRVQQDTRDIE